MLGALLCVLVNDDEPVIAVPQFCNECITEVAHLETKVALKSLHKEVLSRYLNSQFHGDQSNSSPFK